MLAFAPFPPQTDAACVDKTYPILLSQSEY